MNFSSGEGTGTAFHVTLPFAREGDTALRDRLHTALVEMFADGTIEKILAEYGLDPADALGGTAGE